MLDSLKSVIDGWRQARTFRNLLEIVASPLEDLGDDVAGPPLSREEMLKSLAWQGQFVDSFLSKLGGNRAFCTGVVLYSWLSPLYGLRRAAISEGMQARIDYFKQYAASA
jgi:hypothetical protein